MNLTEILYEATEEKMNLETIWDNDFGPIYRTSDGRLACSPVKYETQIYYMGGENNKQVVSKSKEEKDIDQYYAAVEHRGSVIAKLMFSELKSVNDRDGSVVLKIANTSTLTVSNEWGNHILKKLDFSNMAG